MQAQRSIPRTNPLPQLHQPTPPEDQMPPRTLPRPFLRQKIRQTLQRCCLGRNHHQQVRYNPPIHGLGQTDDRSLQEALELQQVRGRRVQSERQTLFKILKRKAWEVLRAVLEVHEEEGS